MHVMTLLILGGEEGVVTAGQEPSLSQGCFVIQYSLT